MTQITQRGSVGRRYIVNVMLRRSALLLMLGSFAGCAGGSGQSFMVQFMPFSATPDGQGEAAVQAAIAFAKVNARAVPVPSPECSVGHRSILIENVPCWSGSSVALNRRAKARARSAHGPRDDHSFAAST